MPNRRGVNRKLRVAAREPAIASSNVRIMNRVKAKWEIAVRRRGNGSALVCLDVGGFRTVVSVSEFSNQAGNHPRSLSNDHTVTFVIPDPRRQNMKSQSLHATDFKGPFCSLPASDRETPAGEDSCKCNKSIRAFGEDVEENEVERPTCLRRGTRGWRTDTPQLQQTLAKTEHPILS